MGGNPSKEIIRMDQTHITEKWSIEWTNYLIKTSKSKAKHKGLRSWFTYHQE